MTTAPCVKQNRYRYVQDGIEKSSFVINDSDKKNHTTVNIDVTTFLPTVAKTKFSSIFP